MSKTHKNSTDFVTVVEHALQHFNDTAWLARHSPLGAPYLLGGYNGATVDSNGSGDNGPKPPVHGATVQQLLQDAIEAVSLHPKYGDRWRKIFTLRYISSNPKTEVQIQDILSLSRGAYHNHRNRAIASLAHELIRKLKPALYLEAPTPLPNLVGRDAELATGQAVLQRGQALNILGPGGIGKTTFGVALAKQFAPTATFWFTFQPGLNDRLSTLLFHLAYFLHGHGVSSLWEQLIAAQGEVKAETLNLVNANLVSLTAKGSDENIVLCFDEVDLLNPTEVEAHAELVPFLHSLRGLVPLMLLGQKPVIEVDKHIELDGLAPFLADQLLQQAGVYLPPGTTHQLCAATAGNLRLLTLFTTLYHARQRAGEPLDDTLAMMSQTLSMEFLLRRLWPHLSQGEMFLLELLAIFRHPVPQETWSATEEAKTEDAEMEEAASLAQLIRWRLVQVDRNGGITLLPAFKLAIQGLLTVDERTALHIEAAEIRLTNGQYTWAAYHYVKNGEHQRAYSLWETYHEQEIDQGQAKASLSLLQSISAQQLEQEDRDRLALRLTELQKLLGNYDDALRQIQATHWRIPFLQVQGERLAGDILEMRGNRAKAIDAYEKALDVTKRWLRESAQLHRAVGYLYARERDFDAGWREVLRIRHDAANLAGVLLNWQGNEIERAAEAYLEALALAREAEYTYGEYNSHLNLGRIYGWLRNLEKAETHLQQAIGYFDRVGNLSKLASAKSNLAVAYCLSEQYQAAIEPAHESLELFEQLDEEFGRAAGLQILAEAYLGLGNLEEAEQFAQRVVTEENIHTQPDGLRVLGEVKLRQGKLQKAEAFVEQSRKIAEETDNPKLQAYALRVLGEIHLAQDALGKVDAVGKADASFAEAINIFTNSGLSAEADKTRALFATVMDSPTRDNHG